MAYMDPMGMNINDMSCTSKRYDIPALYFDMCHSQFHNPVAPRCGLTIPGIFLTSSAERGWKPFHVRKLVDITR